MFNKTQFWVLILFLSFKIGLLNATSVDSDFMRESNEIKSLNNSQYHLESQQIKPTRQANGKDLAADQTAEFEQATKTKSSSSGYLQIKLADNTKNKSFGIKPASLTISYELNSRNLTAQLLPIKQAIEFKQRLSLSTVLNQSAHNSKSNFDDRKSEASIYNLNEFDRLDLAYIEEELLYSKEAGVSYGYDDTSEAIRLLTFESLNLNDKSLIWAALALIGALISIAIYSRFFKDQ